MRKAILLTAVLVAIIFASCKREFEPIDFGKEACVHCKMTIMDKRYATEFVDSKGKVFKFDDITCMRKLIIERGLKESELLMFVADYMKEGSEFIELNKAVILHSEQFSSPMNGNYAAFATKEEAERIKKDNDAAVVDWNDLN